MNSFADLELRQTAEGWTIDCGDYELRTLGALREDGTVRATVGVWKSDALKDRDVVTLSTARGRSAFLNRLSEGGVDIPEAALLALDEAIRQAQVPPTHGYDDLSPSGSPDFEGTGYTLEQLLDELRAFVREYIVLADDQLTAVALWIAHTWVVGSFDATPYLAISSPAPRSGKTRLLEVLSLLVARPWFTGRVSAAVLVRKVATTQPTLLLDETDATFRGNPEYAEALRGVLNSGHRRGGVVSLCVKQGGDFELADFPVFGAKAFAGLGKLPDTVRDRSIAIELKRRAVGEPVRRFRRRDADLTGERLREMCAVWARSVGGALDEARPAIPDCLDDRAADSWEPLLAIAEQAGERWLRRAEAVAVALSTGLVREDESQELVLLRDAQTVFGQVCAEGIFTADFIAALTKIEESPWCDADGKGHALDARRLALLLKPYGIRPKQVRLGETTKKGYRRDDFIDAWKRYVAASPGSPETWETGETISSTRHETKPNDVSDTRSTAETERRVSGAVPPKAEANETPTLPTEARNGHAPPDVSDVSQVSHFRGADGEPSNAMLARVVGWALDHGCGWLKLADSREIGGSVESWNTWVETATEAEVLAAVEAIEVGEAGAGPTIAP